jgi:inhibitor of cysteine peptidase
MSTSDILITPSDQGSTFETLPGDEIVIQLQENITTGYQWEVAEIDPSVVELLNTDYLETPEPGILGRGGTRRLRFRASGAGRTCIQLRLRRSWEALDATIERFEVTVHVRAH